MSAGPIDPRLLRYAAAARWFLIAGALVGVIQTLSIIAVAWFATSLIVRIIEGAALGDLAGGFVLFGASIVVRALSVWLLDVLAARGAASVKSQLRVRVLAAVTRLGPAWLASRSSGVGQAWPRRASAACSVDKASRRSDGAGGASR